MPLFILDICQLLARSFLLQVKNDVSCPRNTYPISPVLCSLACEFKLPFSLGLLSCLIWLLY